MGNEQGFELIGSQWLPYMVTYTTKSFEAVDLGFTCSFNECLKVCLATGSGEIC